MKRPEDARGRYRKLSSKVYRQSASASASNAALHLLYRIVTNVSWIIAAAAGAGRKTGAVSSFEPHGRRPRDSLIFRKSTGRRSILNGR